MKEQSTLDAVGPLLIIAVVALVTGIAVALSMGANDRWGSALPTVSTSADEGD